MWNTLLVQTVVGNIGSFGDFQQTAMGCLFLSASALCPPAAILGAARVCRG